jgi:hypothetical protein
MRKAKYPAILAFISLFWLGVSLAGCSSFYQSLAKRLTPSPSPFLLTATVEAMIDPMVASLEAPTPAIDCAFVWSNHSLPEVSSEINQAFRQEGFPEVEVEASAYGEDCLNPETNQIVRFVAMQTDFYINVSVEGINNSQVMGEWVERSVRILEAFPPGKVPGPNAGYIGISFTSGLENENLWFARSKAKNLIEEGLKGSELYEALRES